jgi:hypothetical protein
MTLNQLIDKANKGYPDGYLVVYWDFVHECVNEKGEGDTLALFIVRELQDTFDRSASDEAQVEEAVRCLRAAQQDLETAVGGLTSVKGAV